MFPLRDWLIDENVCAYRYISTNRKNTEDSGGRQSIESFANRYQATLSKRSNHGYHHEKSIILILNNYGYNHYKFLVNIIYNKQDSSKYKLMPDFIVTMV